MPVAHTLTAYILITNFLKEKILDKKILAILLQFAKIAKIFSLQNFVLYSNLKFKIPVYRDLSLLQKVRKQGIIF